MTVVSWTLEEPMGVYMTWSWVSET